MIISILASSIDGVIGIGNKLPWTCPQDLEFFRKMTLDKEIIVGRKTLEGLPGLLKNRSFHVLTNSDKKPETRNEVISYGPLEVLDVNWATDYDRIHYFVVGGSETYLATANKVDGFIISNIDINVKDDAPMECHSAQAAIDKYRQMILAAPRVATIPVRKGLLRSVTIITDCQLKLKLLTFLVRNTLCV